MAGHENIIRILMEPKYKHPTSGEGYYYALKRSTEGKHIASALLLLDRATFDHISFVYQDLLLMASKNGCLALVKAMVERGADVDVCEHPICSPMDLAARGGHEDIVCYLLVNGAKQERRSAMRDNAITAAAANGRLGTVKLLLQHGADINSRLGPNGTTPLYEAVRHNHVETVRFLLEKGAALEVMRGEMVFYLGYEALEQAIRYGYEEMVRMLAEAGVDVQSVAPDCTENSPPPIILAKMWSHDDIVLQLLELGAEDIDPLKTRWADDFRKGVYPKSSWTLRSQRTG